MSNNNQITIFLLCKKEITLTLYQYLPKEMESFEKGSEGWRDRVGGRTDIEESE